MENAEDLWQDIKERLSVMNGSQIQQLKSELADCKQRGMSIVAYYGKLKTLWEELAYAQILSRTCRKCECKIGSQLER